ncbi:MAG TPA: ABC transporter ATP-binding protein [Chloroflexota bacterium]|nr:ABC transporter ATP-binding protein [Chloroflexota bacterium]
MSGEAQRPKSVREKLAERAKALAGVPRVLRLVWDAQPRLALTLLSLNVLQGIQPAVSLYLSKLVIDAVAATIQQRLAAGAGGTGVVLGAAEVSPLVEWLTEVLGLGGVPGAAWGLTVLGLSVGVAALSGVLEPTATRVQLQLGDQLSREMQTRILTKANSLADVSYFENPAFYDALQRAQNDAGYRPLNVLAGVISLFRNVVQLMSMLAVLARFGPLVAVAAVALALPNLYLQLASQYETFSINRWNIAEVRRMSYFVQLITMKEPARELRIFGLTDYFLDRFLDEFRAFHGRLQAVRKRHMWLDLGCAALTSLGFVGMYVYFVVLALARRVSLGDLTLSTGALFQAQSRTLDLVRQLGSLYGDVLFVGQVFEFLDTKPAMAVPSPEEAQPTPALRRGIELRDVTFVYPGTERPVLEHFNLTIRPGECVALVGENGAGKTTIVKLLGRLYDPTEGRILVDGVDLREVNLEEWRGRIGAIFQDFCRYHLPAKTNIGLGNLAKLDEVAAIERAAARGGAAAVIEKLEEGYDTVLGRWLSTGMGKVQREGAELSGGEWQKVALSRGFMRSDGNGNGSSAEGDAQLLILDEPTAALDTQSEYDVYLRFHELTKGKATLLISHRFSTVRMADRIVVLEHGKIIEDGTHAALMALGGTYADLYEKQASKYR